MKKIILIIIFSSFIYSSSSDERHYNFLEKKIKSGAKNWNELRSKVSEEHPDYLWLFNKKFDNLDFNGYNFSKILMGNCILNNLKISNSDFNHATLKKCKIQNVNFNDSNLDNIQISKSDINNVVFRNCTMKKIHIGWNLKNLTFINTNASYSKFRYSGGKYIIIKRSNFKHVFFALDYINSIFEEVDFRYSTFGDYFFSFMKSRFNNVDFSYSKFSIGDLRKQSNQFKDSYLNRVKFDNCHLGMYDFKMFGNSYKYVTKFTKLLFKDTDFNEISFNKAKFDKYVEFINCSFNRTKFNGSEFITQRNKLFRNTLFKNCIFKNCEFRNIKTLNNARFVNCDFKYVEIDKKWKTNFKMKNVKNSFEITWVDAGYYKIKVNLKKLKTQIYSGKGINQSTYKNLHKYIKIIQKKYPRSYILKQANALIEYLEMKLF